MRHRRSRSPNSFGTHLEPLHDTVGNVFLENTNHFDVASSGSCLRGSFTHHFSTTFDPYWIHGICLKSSGHTASYDIRTFELASGNLT